MRNKVYLKYLLFLSIWIGSSSLTTLIARYPDKAGSKNELSEDIKKNEKAFDLKILDMNRKLARYLPLMDVKIKFTPERTEFTKNREQNYIQMESYSFIPKSKLITGYVGLRYRSLRLYFSGGQLSRIESKMFERNFDASSKLEITVVDPSPNTEETGDITINRNFNDAEIKKIALANMENTTRRPLRRNFKRDYYQKNLFYFEGLYKIVDEWQNRIGGSSDKALTDDLTNSLDYY